MAGTIRLNKGQLNDLIENAKANGGNSEELEGLLAEVEAEEGQTRPGPPQARRRPRADLDEEEETTEEHLNNKVGYLFPGGIYGEILEKIIAIDRSYNSKEIQQMCRDNGLSASNKDKKVMAAKLLAHNVNLEAGAPEEILPQTERGVNLAERLPVLERLPGGERPPSMSPRMAQYHGEAVPRYFYHVGKKTKRGDIKSYKIRETEAADSFGEGYAEREYVWLSQKPDLGPDYFIIDITKLDNANLRFTGQIEGHLLHVGDIPAGAIVGEHGKVTVPGLKR